MAPVDEETQKQTRVVFLTVQSWTSKYNVGQRRRKEIFTRKLQWSKLNALSFYGSKMILYRPNHFGQITIVLVECKSFWSGPNHFGQVQIKLFWTNFYNLDLSKTIWTVQNKFGNIGQGTSLQ